LHVFRRYFAAEGEFDGLEVDAYVVVSERYLVMCDTLLSPEDMAQMMEEVSSELHGRQLLVFNSHADWDHCWGNSYFSGSNTAPIIAHQHSVTRLRSAEAQETLEYYQQRYPQFAHVVLTEPTITFTDSLTIHGGDLDMQLLHAPGHHADHSAMWIPEMSLLLAFDAVEKPFPMIENADGVPAMLATLAQFLQLQPQRVLCSHGKSSSPDMINKNLAYLHEIEKRCRDLLSQQPASAIALEQIGAMLNYSFDEAIEQIMEQGEGVDRTYYSEVHEHNIRCIWQWLISES
jgi:glyoxylase-like metal-dependent hydrolase (beta-lactamase superfamily II)